ncbi:MAG: alanine--glyoxylate aminotransferase family protein [Candidatus Tectomicrobia bacterium]|uniref:Alanine--glyoxylate aminotransferase family protein n=1 Tax=Tectimicrobiota bacterium TaxID=2528274 RepID=A0A932FXH1_UNCTE|nr:alanine--glyoxylate aminotransferase family protein [Candidatus Tectomicrobia bacterium]
MSQTYPELNPGLRILLGPGPSDVHPRVLKALSTPLVGHLDPDFLKLMNETMALLRFVFQTENRLTLPVSGTGSAGMEACLCNLIEPGAEVIIGENGLIGERMCHVAGRCGAEVRRVEAEWGRILEPGQIEAALKPGKARLVALVHAETSTGVCQPLEEISRLAREYGALLLVDTVTSLGGSPVTVDRWGVDAAYSGTQKCLSAPPGLAPVTLGPRAMEAVRGRKKKVQSWYLDLSMVERYWGEERVYHHTAPISMIYALREALRLIQEEGLDERFARHQRNHRALAAGLQALGLELSSQEGHRLPMLNAVRIPDGIDDLKVRRHLLQEFGIEIGGGLGPLKGKIWRIGLMGHSSSKNNVLLVLGALGQALEAEGYRKEPGAAVVAALRVYGE